MKSCLIVAARSSVSKLLLGVGCILGVAIGSSSSGYAIDTDGDSLSELFFFSKRGQLTSVSPQTGVVQAFASGRKKADGFFAGRWFSDGSVGPGTFSIRRNGPVFSVVAPDGRTISLNPGISEGIIFAGIDVDGNGIGDVVAVDENGAGRLFANFFSDSSFLATFSLPTSAVRNGVPLVTSGTDGELISFAQFQRSSGQGAVTVSGFNTNGAQTAIQFAVNARGTLSAAHELVTPGGEKAFLLVFQTKRGRRTAQVYSQSGALLASRALSKRSSELTGDFLSSEGGEVALHTKRSLQIWNPASGEVRRVGRFRGAMATTIARFGQEDTSSDSSSGSDRTSGTDSGNSTSGGGGTVVGNGPCDRFANPRDGAGGFLAKNSDHSGVVYLTPDGGYRNGVILHPRTLRKVADTRYTGVANGGRGHFRIGGSLPFGEHVFGAERNGQLICWRIPDGTSRVD